MISRISIAGFLAATVAGMSTGALATTSDTTAGHGQSAASVASVTSSTGSPNGAGPAGGKGARKHPLLRAMAKRVVRAEVVTRNKDGQFVTHDVIRGAVTSVSATSISVTSADKTSETFTVGKATRVRSRGTQKGSGKRTTIGAVHDGDQVVVIGTGSSTLTAKRIVDLGS